MQCKHCHHHFEGQFCPNCGQKRINERVNLSRLWQDLMSGAFDVNAKLPHTVLLLVRQPEKPFHDFINGITVPYVNPFRLALFIITVMIFLLLINKTINDYYLQ